MMVSFDDVLEVLKTVCADCEESIRDLKAVKSLVPQRFIDAKVSELCNTIFVVQDIMQKVIDLKVNELVEGKPKV